MKFPIVSSCPRCQALQDGRRFFELVERAAVHENLTVDRFVDGLRESLALALIISAEVDLETFETLTTDQIAALANKAAVELAAAIRARDPALVGHEVH